MTKEQSVRLMNPCKSGEVLCQFRTIARDWRVVLSEALAMLHPSWAGLSYMQSQLQSHEDGEWVWYL